MARKDRIQPLPDLAHRRTRVKLLLRSYLAAIDGEKGSDEKIGHGNKPGSRGHRHGSLWREGSYAPLDRALETLRAERRCQSFHVWGCFISDTKPREARLEKANRGLERILELMPRDVWVPEEVSVGGGYKEFEAKLWVRKNKKRMAA